MQKALFIHRSVGQNLIDDGTLRSLIQQQSLDIELDDYNQNTDTLTTNTSSQKAGLDFPDNDTKPSSLAAIFGSADKNAFRPILELVARYDIVMVKSCYPNSDIKNTDELRALQESYQTIMKFFASSNQRLIIMTSPPLRPWRTSSVNAARARTLNNWLAETVPARNIRVFDFFDLLANPTEHRQANTLRKQYRRILFLDNHPNKKASKMAAVKFVDFLRDSTVQPSPQAAQAPVGA